MGFSLIKVITGCWHPFTRASFYPLWDVLCQTSNQSSWFSASSDPLWEPFALCYQTLRVKTHQVSDFPRNFIEFTLWHWEGGWWWRKQGGLTELFRKQRRHQRSIMPHCGGWMWLIVFAGESGRKREGRQDACDVWSQPDCDFKKKKEIDYSCGYSKTEDA